MIQQKTEDTVHAGQRTAQLILQNPSSSLQNSFFHPSLLSSFTTYTTPFGSRLQYPIYQHPLITMFHRFDRSSICALVIFYYRASSSSSSMVANAWTSPASVCTHIHPHNPRFVSSVPLFMSSTVTSKESTFDSSNNNKSNSNNRRKKTVRDRTNEEAVSMIQDIIQAGVEAGPQAGIVRSLQAYRAVATTVADFLPLPAPIASSLAGRGGRSSSVSSTPETFSAPVALRKLFERLGATYIKLGQFIASSPTLFPAEYVKEFQKCLDNTEPLEWSVIEAVIKKELCDGGPTSRVFSSIDKTPLASASIAQVHKAKLKSTGEDVVIKVQKPNIDSVLKADLNFIYIASRILEFLQPDFERTSLSAIAGDIKSSMLEELDFNKEATNVEEFREFLTNNNFDQIAKAPKVFEEYTTKKCMTMEFLRGVSLLDSESIAKISSDPEATIITALNVWTTSVLTMPWFHADVHAGNLLVLEDGRVGFIDFGIVGRVSEKTFTAVSELSGALAVGDYYGMAKALSNMGATDETVDIDKFAKDIERVLVNLSQVSRF